MLIWLEVDAMLRQRTRGARGMDDFAKIFFAGETGKWQAKPVTQAEIVATLNGLTPFDWDAFFTQRLTEKAASAPLTGLAQGGYRIVYVDTPTPYFRDVEKRAKEINLAFSLGMIVGKDGEVTQVIWDSPAFNAGLSNAAQIIAVNGRTYSDDGIRDAVAAAKGGRDPIHLIVKSGNRVREVAIQWTSGPRYPKLEKVASGDGSLDRLLAPRS